MTDDGEWLDVAACARRRGITPGTWRVYVHRGYAPAPDDPDDQDGRPPNHRRPRWRPETVDNFPYPGRGRRTVAARRARAEAEARALERAGDHAATAAVVAWLTGHHRQLLAAAAELVDQRDDLVDAAGDAGEDLAAAIDAAGEHMTGAPSRSLAAGVTYALGIVAGLPGGLGARELGAFRGLRDGYEQVRPRPQLRTESGNDT